MSLLAGTAQTTITPRARAPLLGTIQRSNGINDDLHARALVLNDGGERVAILCLDLIGTDFELADEIRGAVREKSGIVTTLINCSHTHSAPFTIPWSVLGSRWLSGPGKQWRDDLVTRLAELVTRAEANSARAVLRAGRAPVQIGSNRRLLTNQGIVMKPDPAGVVVPWVDVLLVDRVQGSLAAILFSHGAHPVTVHGSSRLISADYPGFAAQRIQGCFGGDVLTMFGQACGANINADPLRGGFAAASKAGAALAEAVVKAASTSQPLPEAAFTVTSVRTGLALMPLPDYDECFAALQKAEERRAECCGKDIPADERLWDLQDEVEITAPSRQPQADDVQPMEGQPWWLTDTVLCLRDLLAKIQRGDERPLRFEAQMLRIRDRWALLAATHELFAEYQLWFEKTAPAEQCMMLAYTNACESYVPTDRDFALGGYEAATFPSLDAASLRYRHRRSLRPGAEQQVLDQLRALWA